MSRAHYPKNGNRFCHLEPEVEDKIQTYKYVYTYIGNTYGQTRETVKWEDNDNIKRIDQTTITTQHLFS